MYGVQDKMEDWDQEMKECAKYQLYYKIIVLVK